jgi:hypothetical protein
LRGPFEEFFADGQAHRLDTIDHPGNGSLTPQAPAGIVKLVIALTEVAVPTGLRQRLA